MVEPSLGKESFSVAAHGLKIIKVLGILGPVEQVS